MKLTIEHVIDLVDQLPKNNLYDYVSGGKNKAKLIGVNRDDQKLEIVRVNSDNSESGANMSKDVLEKLCSKVNSNQPFKFDSVLDGSGNTRSTFEAIFAHTTEFYACKVGNVKHLIWVPQIKHEIGEICYYDTIKDKIQELGFSNERQYILAGNSIVVDVLANIFKELFKEEQ